MLPTVSHSGKTWTATRVINTVTETASGRQKLKIIWWPLDELFTRRPGICFAARDRYDKLFPNGIAEGRAKINCICADCKKAWIIGDCSIIKL